MKDTKTENYLNDGQYAFEFRAKVPIRSIDLVGARINPARAHRKVDPDRVNAYGVAMLDGTDFPAIVVFDTGASMLALATGMHRLEAAIEAGIEVFDAYVVMEPVEYRRELLIRSINSIEGFAPTQIEQLKLAAEILRLYPDVSSIKATAIAFKLKEDTLIKFIRASEADDRAFRLGVFDLFCGLPRNTKLEFHGIQNDHNFAAAVGVVANHSLKGGEAEAFIRDVKKARSEAGGHALVEKKERELEQRNKRNKAKHGKTHKAKSTKVISTLKSFNRMGPLPNFGLDGIEPADLDEVAMVFEETADLVAKAIKWVRSRIEEQNRKAAWEITTRRGDRPSVPDLHAP